MFLFIIFSLFANIDVSKPPLNELKLSNVQKSSLSYISYKWPNSEMHYSIDAAFTSSEKVTIKDGMAHIMENSCIKFIKRTDEHDYVDIVPGTGGCYTEVAGYRFGYGRR